MCQICMTVWVLKGRVGFTTYNNEPIQDFGPKFSEGGMLCRTLGQNSGGGPMQDFGPEFRGGGGCYAVCVY